MARLRFPDEASRMVWQIGRDNRFGLAADLPAVAYASADESDLTLADIRTVDGQPIAGSALTVDKGSGLPDFDGPDGDVDVVYVSVAGGPRRPVYARAQNLVAAAVETAAADAAAKADAAQAAAIAASLPKTAGKNLFDPSTAQIDKFWNGSPSVIDLPGWSASVKYPLVNGESYTVNNARNVQVWNAAGTAATQFINNPSEGPVTVTGSATNGWVSWSVATSKVNLCQFENSSSATPFEPFGYVIDRQIVNGGFLADQVATLTSGVTAANRLPNIQVFRSGNNMVVRSPFDAARDIVMPWTLSGGANGMVQPSSSSLASVVLVSAAAADSTIWPTYDGSGTSVHGAGDDNAPVLAGWSYVGGNHGWAAAAQVTANGHGKTTADLGSQWSDGTRTYTLVQVVDANKLLFAGPYTVASGIVTGNITAPAATLTHVSEATNTASVPITGGVLAGQQIYPSVYGQTTKVDLDGKPLADGKSGGQVLSITETYYVLSYKGLLDTVQTNIGTPYTSLLASVPTFARISNTYRITSGGTVVVAQRVTAVEKQNICVGVTQATGLVTPVGGKLRQFMAGIGAAGGLDFSTLADLSTMSGTLDIAPASYLNPNSPAVSARQWAYDSAGNPQYGLAVGILPVGDGHPAQRIKYATTKSWFMSGSTKKNYPQVVWLKTLNPGESVAGTAYRRYLAPPDTVSEFTVSDGTDTWAVIERTTTTSEGRAQAAPLLGRRLVPAGPTTINAADRVTGEGIAYSAPSTPAYGMFRAAPEPPRLETLPGATGPAGTYFLMHQGTVSTQILTGSYQILYLFPMCLPEAVWVDRAALEVTVVGTGVIRHGVYAHDPTSGLPVLTGPLADFGTLDVTSAGVKESVLAGPVLLPEGWHWYGLVWQQVNTTAPTYRTMNVPSGTGPLNIGGSVSLMSSPRNGYFASGVAGVLGALALTATAAHQLNAPRVAYRRA